MKRVGLVFGGRSVEHEVSVRSARSVAEALKEAGHQVVPLGLAPDGCWAEPNDAAAALGGATDQLSPVGEKVLATLGRLADSGAEVIFPIVHGTYGEDGSLQGLCEMLDLPYAGTGVTSSAIAMVLAAQDLPVVDWEGIGRIDFAQDPDGELARLDRFAPPIFVKPSVGGSSVGISKVTKRGALRAAIEHALRFDDTVVVERNVTGRELECAVLGLGEIEASVIGEIVPGKDFYDYADKYLDDGAQLIAPAELEPAVTDQLRARARSAFAAIGGWGMGRVDFLLEDNGIPWINEINTLPGFTSISMYPRLWGLSGVPFPELVDRLVRIAIERHAERRNLDAGIKAWIAELANREGHRPALEAGGEETN